MTRSFHHVPRKTSRREVAAESDYRIRRAGDRVKFTHSGALLGKEGVIEHVRPDGLLIVHLDEDPEGSIRVLEPSKVARVNR